MEQQENIFSGGMNQDLPKTKIPANMYYQSYNFRLTTDKGLSNSSLENIRGNLSLLSIPDLPEFQKIALNLSTLNTVDITISDGVFSDVGVAPFTTTATTTTEDLYDYFQEDAGYANLNSLYYIYYNDLYLVFVPTSTTLTYTVIPSGVAATDIVVTSYVPAQTNLEVIGSTFINNDIYLITTNCKDQAPGDTDPDSYGQVWKLVINDVTNTGTLTNLYNNQLDLSTYNAIAPTAILGRYENSTIQRIYWTDNYNRLRSLNVIDPQVKALDLSLIDVQPATDFDIPLMTDIRSASSTALLPIGCYQLAYKLSNVGGSSSTYSVPSNPIYVVSGDLTVGVNAAEENQQGGALWADYRGAPKGTTTTKRITWTINNLDREFQRIEAVLLVRETRTESPTIYSLFEAPILGDSIDVVIDGDIITSSDTVTIPLEEYLALSSVFTHCKTIETKDNRLVVGNVRNEYADLEYDARAYRFASGTNNTRIVENGGAVTYTITTPATDYLLIDEESDAIAVANIEFTDPGNYNNAYRFRRGSTVLGGDGPNISYEFISVAVACDKTLEPVNPQPLPIVSTNPDYAGASAYNLNVYSADKNGVDVLQEYPIAFPSNINDGMKFPQMNSIYWGNQHNEIYRYGIQFYDKSKNPYFVKWIGDVKFPDYFDTCPAANLIFADGTQVDTVDPTIVDYRKSFVITAGAHGSNESYVCQLGLKLNVTIPDELTGQIEGYSIVRVKREESDKTIIAEGIISNTFILTAANTYHLPSGIMDYDNVGTSKNMLSFLTPNILDSSLTVPTAGMRLRTSTELVAANTTRDISIIGGAGPANGNKILKYVGHQDLGALQDHTIDFTGLMGLNGSLSYSGDAFNNFGITGVPDNTSNGNPSYLLVLNGAGITSLATTDLKYFAYIYNPIINQYGGNRYIDRANNEYIICSHFRSTKTNIIGYTDSSYIFGGDVTNDLMDEERISVDWAAYIPGPGAIHNTTTFFYPASSSVNRNLRHGRHPNTNLDDLITLNDDRTDYFYNTMYSTQNDILKFFPKPDPFILTEEYVNRFHISQIKINGELTDAWSRFKPLDYWDVEGSYGPINAIIVLQNEAYFVQDKAFGKLLINPKTAITSTTGEEIQLGRGGVIDSHDYVSIETGSTHQFSVIRSGTQIYFVDFRHKKIFAFSQNRPLNPQTDLKGMHSWMINNIYGNIENIDKPVYDDLYVGRNGVHGVYDYINDEMIYTFFKGVSTGEEQSLTTPYTLVYSEKLSAFTGFYSHFPKNYITNNKKIVSANPGVLQDLYLHNFGEYGKFYGTYASSIIEFFSNKYSQFTKIFDNLMFQTEVQNGTTLVDIASGPTPVQETFNTLEVSTDYQSNSITLTPFANLVRKFRSWRTQVLRSNAAGAYVSPTLFSRMKDKYLRIKLTYNNNGNKRFILHSVISFFRPHKPG